MMGAVSEAFSLSVSSLDSDITPYVSFPGDFIGGVSQLSQSAMKSGMGGQVMGALGTCLCARRSHKPTCAYTLAQNTCT